MKLKRLFSLILVLTLFFNLSACRVDTPSEDSSSSTSHKEDSENDQQGTKPLLYKVTDDSGNTVWLFGSIHVGHEDYYPLPDYVLDAFDGSDALAVECNIIDFENDTIRQYMVLSKMKYTYGTTIDDDIPDDLYDDSVEIFTDLGLYSSALDNYFPILWSQTIESALYEELGADVELGIDRHLMARAEENNKEILEVESVEFQYQMQADFSLELQILLLQNSIEAYNDRETYEEELNKLMNLWASGDEKSLEEFLTDDTSELTEDEKVLYEEYNNAMIVERNKTMTDYAEEALLSGDEIFICVGAAHVVGDGGIAQLMQERGYTVEIIN